MNMLVLIQAKTYYPLQILQKSKTIPLEQNQSPKIQQFRDFFFKHVEDKFIYAYSNKSSFKFDLCLQQIDSQPCKFDQSYFGASWFPCMSIQNTFYGIYERKLYMLKDYNIIVVSDAPNVGGYGYSYIDSFIICYDVTLSQWFAFDVSGKFFEGKWIKIQKLWDRAKVMMCNYNDEIYVMDMGTSDFLVAQSFDPQNLTTRTFDVKKQTPLAQKYIGSVYQSLLFFVNELGQEKYSTLVDVSEMPPKVYECKTYIQQFHNSYITNDLVFSKTGVQKLPDVTQLFGFDYYGFEIRRELNKQMRGSYKIGQMEIKLTQVLYDNQQQQKQIDELKQELVDCKYLISRLAKTIVENSSQDQQHPSRDQNLSQKIDQIMEESQSHHQTSDIPWRKIINDKDEEIK